MESLSRWIYPAHCLSIPKPAIKDINQANFKLIWTYNTDDEEGGLKAVD